MNTSIAGLLVIIGGFSGEHLLAQGSGLEIDWPCPSESHSRSKYAVSDSSEVTFDSLHY